MRERASLSAMPLPAVPLSAVSLPAAPLSAVPLSTVPLPAGPGDEQSGLRPHAPDACAGPRAPGARAALAELCAPPTCRVPRSERDVRRTDWLLRRLAPERHAWTAALFISMPASIFALLASTFATGAGALGLSVGAALCAALAALVAAEGYALALAHGQLRPGATLGGRLVCGRVERVGRRDLRRAMREARSLDRRGWRPREGIPHPEGRADTHDRWLIEAHAVGRGAVLGIRRWRCCRRYRSPGPAPCWQPLGLGAIRWFGSASADLVALAEYRAVLQERARRLEARARADQQLAAMGRERAAQDVAVAAAIVGHVNETAIPGP